MGSVAGWQAHLENWQRLRRQWFYLTISGMLLTALWTTIATQEEGAVATIMTIGACAFIAITLAGLWHWHRTGQWVSFCERMVEAVSTGDPETYMLYLRRYGPTKDIRCMPDIRDEGASR